MKNNYAFLLVLLLCPAAHAAPPSALPGLPLPVTEPAAVNPAADWHRLTPAQQRQARANYAAFKALDADSRRRIGNAAAAWSQLPADRQRNLLAKYQAQDRMVRDGWRLGPELGADYSKLQPLVGYVPASQREAMLALLRQLDAEQRAHLVLISQRTPPQDREALRNELLALPASARSQWLQRNVNR